MRNKLTNVLQIAVLITGLFYVTVGIFYYISPASFGKIVGLKIHSDWIAHINIDEFNFMLFIFSRGLSLLLFSTGLSMVLPLFDPLKYRGLIYVTCVIFPGIVSGHFLYYGIMNKYNSIKILGAIFLFIFVYSLITLVLTQRNANKGIE